MINQKLMPKAYTEILEILKYIPREDYNKIPQNIIQNITESADVTYKYQVSHFDDFQEQPMLHETECILAVLFRDYLATEREHKAIKEFERKCIIKIEEEKRKEYDSNNLFKNKTIESIPASNSSINQNTNQNLNKEIQLVDYKENIMIKIKNFLLRLFRKRIRKNTI